MITPEQEARIKAALTPDDYQALLAEVSAARSEARSARLAASTEKGRADHNWEVLANVTAAGKDNARRAQIGRTVALRFTNPNLGFTEEQEAKQLLIDAHLTEKEQS